MLLFHNLKCRLSKFKVAIQSLCDMHAVALQKNRLPVYYRWGRVHLMRLGLSA